MNKWIRYGISDIVSNEDMPKYACVFDSNDNIIAEPQIYYVEDIPQEEIEQYD